MVLTPEEQQFKDYWEENRLKKLKLRRILALLLPLASLVVIAIFFNFFSGWFKKAEMVRNQWAHKNDLSLIIVLLVAAISIVVFIVIFSVRHKWDINEQRYQELLAREKEQ